MEDLGNLVTRVPLAPVKREKMSQAQLEELVSREVKVSKFSKKAYFRPFQKAQKNGKKSSFIRWVNRSLKSC